MDRLGIYLYVQQLGQAGEVRRVSFLRPVADERDARSSLTMMAQLAWERERSYVPVRVVAPLVCCVKPQLASCLPDTSGWASSITREPLLADWRKHDAVFESLLSW